MAKRNIPKFSSLLLRYFLILIDFFFRDAKIRLHLLKFIT